METRHSMTFRERMLYHQIHPVKLLTDGSSAVIATWLMWTHLWVAALVVAFLPPVLMSSILIGLGRLDEYRASALGRYVAKNLTHTMEAVRLAGLVLVWLGAWYHVVWLIPAGLAVILAAWFRGWLFRSRGRRGSAA
jgi:hypothetical protein